MSIVTTQKVADPNKAMFARLRDLVGVELAFGWIEDAEAATIATYNHFEDPANNRPARDTLTPTAARFEGEIKDAAKRAAKVAASGGDVVGTVGALESQLGETLRQSIRDFSDPPNAPATIRQKGFNDPLIGAGDGGRILNGASAKLRPREKTGG